MFNQKNKQTIRKTQKKCVEMTTDLHENERSDGFHRKTQLLLMELFVCLPTHYCFRLGKRL